MPNSVEAERNLLCCIMRDADMQSELMANLSPVDFYQSNHAEIYSAMQKIEAQSLTVDFASVTDYLRRNGILTVHRQSDRGQRHGLRVYDHV